MTASSKIKLWAIATAALSLLLGATAILWTSFGVPAWFFVLTQIWFWTIGLPTMVGVLGVTAAWGIPGWTTLPLWLYIPCAVMVAAALQYASLRMASRLWQRINGRHP